FIDKTFDDLEEAAQKKLRNAVLKAVVLVYPKDDPDIKFTAFQRINTGSVVLNQQEIRNCIYGGSLNDLLFQLNEKNKTWRKLLSGRPDKRMKDVETILRFFAAYFNDDNYEKPITSFLNTFMEKNRNISPEKAKEWKELFDSVLDTAVKNIGSLFPRTTESKTFNRAIFESVLTAVARLKVKRNFNPRGLKKKYEKLIQNPVYMEAVTSQTSDKKKYQSRIELAIKMLS
ncbi:MAG: hypothetical protein U1A25_00875, partial [Candidatus Sungbacteria bacterium]|nr:hypothetical protein [Candidatus Sungbacteria bacterium]